MRAEALLAALLVAAAGPAWATVPAGFDERRVASGLERPVALAAAPDGTLYIGEQHTGRIRIWRNGQLLPAPFATITPLYTNSEAGLLGLAVSPDYLVDRHVYVFASASSSRQRVLRLTNAGDVGVSETVIVPDLPARGVNHNGGALAFGPDGTLYVSVGDNAVGALSPAPTEKAGKVLRYHRDGSVPADNPWANNPVWALGLRNTFRLAFQPGTGTLFGTENGPNSDDELNIIRRGLHHGWPDVMGVAGQPARYVDPIAVYTPVTAVVGLAFHDGRGQPALAGSLLVAHHKPGTIRRLTLGGPAGETVTSDADLVTNAGAVVDLAIGSDGAVYHCNLGGDVFRVTTSGGASNIPPFASFTARPSSGGAPLVADLDGSGSSDVDGMVVDWQWDLGAGQGTRSGPTALHTYTQPGNYTVTLTVTDALGARSSTTQRIDVSNSTGNPPPSAHIQDVTPSTGKKPLRVQLTGHGHDDTDVVEHRWSWGDGTPDEVIRGAGRDVNSAPSHEFQQQGDFTITLTVVDDQGATGTHTRQAHVDGCALGRPAPGGHGAPLALLALLLVLVVGRRPG